MLQFNLNNDNSIRGFTLVELLIAMALALVILASLASTFVFQRKTYDVQQEISEMIQTARAAMDTMSREVRMAGFNPTGAMQTTDPTAANFVGIPYDSTQLQIIADLNEDGETDGSSSDDDSNEEIVYKFYNTTQYPEQIKRKTGNGYFQPFAENIKSFSFEYFKEDEDGDGNPDPAATTEEIRMVRITIEAKTEKEDPDYSHPDNSDGYRTFEVESYITAPNLKYNQE